MLTDPRRYGGGHADDGLLALAHDGRREALIAALRELAAAGRDAEIRAALAAAPSQHEYSRVWRALCVAIEKPASEDVLAPQLFAIPWVIVAAGTAPASVACVLADRAALMSVFEQHGVFGGSRSVGLSNALCSIEALEALAPSAVMRGWEDQRVRELPPAPIAVLRGVEEVHVRFLAGAAITPPHAPDVVETGANIGAWGTPALRAMSAQLATANVQLLPMPRPPAGLYSAAHAGRFAGLEAAFNLFVSNSVRRFRMAIGDPNVTLSSHENAQIRVTLWTPLDDAMVEGFTWPLHPADDLAEVERTITTLLEECRLPQPTVHEGVLPERTPTGATLFPSRSP